MGAVAALAVACGSTNDATTPAPTSTAAPTSTPDTSTAVAEPFKVAWILSSPHNDAGWSQAHYDGLQYVQAQLGDKVKTDYKENVKDADTASVIDQLLADGTQMIFATSFGEQDAMAAAAAAHPDVKFEMATGFKTSDNLAEFFGAGEDAVYLSGMAAGAATKNGKVGYVAAFPIPEVIRHANAFALGVLKMHPGATVKLVWTKSWFAPDVETKAAQSLIAAGVDVIGQNVDSPAAGQVAQKAGLPWVGYDSDASTFAPDQWLTAAVYNWGPYELKRVQAAMDGTWTTGSYYGGLGDGFVDIAPFGKSVTQATQDAIATAKADLISGAFYEFQGPLKDQSGTERVAAGAKMSLADILGMDWFVEGVEGNPKG